MGTIWSNSSLLKQMRSPELVGRCGICEFQRNCGGCRARAFATNGSLWGEDPFCIYQPRGESKVEIAGVTWEEEASARLQKMPGFIRDRVKQGVEAFARFKGYAKVDGGVMDEVLYAMGRPMHRNLKGVIGSGLRVRKGK